MATATQVAEYRAATSSLVLLAQRDLADFWGSLNLDGSPVAVRNALEGFFPELVTAYGDAAALLGADWYDMLRDAPPSASRFQAVMARPVDAEQANASARWGLGPLFSEGDSDGAFALLSGSTQRLVMQPFRTTVYESARADSQPVRFARMPTGAVTCRFCTMVASRGFVYRDAASAGESNDWHDNCNCLIVPGNGPDSFPEGYDVQVYRDAYARAEGLGRDLIP
jgi:hypothetical protein